MMCLTRPRIVTLFALFITVRAVSAQGGLPTPVRGHPPQAQPRLAPAPPAPLRKASDLIHRQEPINVNQPLLKKASADQVRVVVSLTKQRAYLLMSDDVVIDCPISSGKRGHTSPSGSFTVLEKDPNHHSTIYGDFVDQS